MNHIRVAGPESYYMFHLNGTNIYMFGDDHDELTTCDHYDIEITHLLNSWLNYNESHQIFTNIHIEEIPVYGCISPIYDIGLSQRNQYSWLDKIVCSINTRLQSPNIYVSYHSDNTREIMFNEGIYSYSLSQCITSVVDDYEFETSNLTEYLLQNLSTLLYIECQSSNYIMDSTNFINSLPIKAEYIQRMLNRLNTIAPLLPSGCSLLAKNLLSLDEEERQRFINNIMVLFLERLQEYEFYIAISASIMDAYVLYKIIYTNKGSQTILYMGTAHIQFYAQYLSRFTLAVLIEYDINDNVIRCVNTSSLPVTLM